MVRIGKGDLPHSRRGHSGRAKHRDENSGAERQLVASRVFFFFADWKGQFGRLRSIQSPLRGSNFLLLDYPGEVRNGSEPLLGYFQASLMGLVAYRSSASQDRRGNPLFTS